MIKPQKALHLYQELEKKRTKIAEDLFYIFEKYDGWYGLKSVDSKAFSPSPISSRARRRIPSCDTLSSSIQAYETKAGWTERGTIIFEILVAGVPVFKDLNGILNRSKGNCQAKDAYIRVHDFIPHGNTQMPMEDRYELVKEYVLTINHPRVKLANLTGIGTHQDVQMTAEDIWARKSTDRSDEGAIGKRIGAPYSEGKRNKDIIKVKCEVSLDLKVVLVEEGEGKYAGTLGKLIVQSADGTRNSVSGMSDAERDEWWDNPQLILGKVVEVQAMQVLENGSLREGRFKAVRHDKDIREID